jgi:hypothetical protein
MKPLRPLVNFLVRHSVLAAFATGAQGQSFCASDGQPRPTLLLERFINADCAECWTSAQTPTAGPRTLALDWIVPGARGDDAPLAAVANRDSASRLQALKPAEPVVGSWSRSAIVGHQTPGLRVAHGLPVAGYVGTSIELKPMPRAASGANWTGWLALVEQLPEGAEGSPVQRNLVRNLLQLRWLGEPKLSRFFEARVMNLPQGMDPARYKNLSLVGWVEDAEGRVVTAGQTRCK